MRVHFLALGALTAIAGLGFTQNAFAETNGRKPSSLLLGPEFDNRAGETTLVTITNTNCDFNVNPQNNNLYRGTTEVEIIYIGKFGPGGVVLPCTEFNRTILLSPCDTFTFITAFHNPGQQQGFFYAFAKNPVTDAPWDFDFLIGNVMRIDGITNVEYSTNLVGWRGLTGDYNNTNTDGDSLRDLDDVEYQSAPDTILIPRFMAASGRGNYNSELILIGLSGGASFTTVVDFLIYNDNEDEFSAQRTFQCWERVTLLSISSAFGNAWLQTTNHAPGEILGAPQQEAGWFLLDGAFAYSSVEQINNPAVYGVLVEKIQAGAAASDLPWERGDNKKGDLFGHTILGDGGLDGY